jgi:hypothetical protein
VVSVNYQLIGANGDAITFDNSNFVLNPGMAGFGIPPTEVRIAPSAKNGGLWRNTKRGVRDLDLPITVLGNNRADVQAKLRRLAKLTQDVKGPTVLRALYSNGQVLTMEVHYTAGAESQWGESAGMTFCEWLLSFQAPDPFWESTAVESFTITSGASGRGLLPELTKLKLISSQALGEITVDNTGDVSAQPIWLIRGPLESLTITSGLESFGINTPILAGEVITIDTSNKTVVDDTGANRYAILSPAPKFFTITPGISSISIIGEGTTTETDITCTYRLRFEVVH